MRRVPAPHIAVHYPADTHGPQHPVRIVIHDTECPDAPGTSEITGVANYWTRQRQGLGAHYIIDGAGNIGQGAHPTRIAWAVAGHNTGSIHIELIGYAAWSRLRWLKRGRQLRALARLIAYLADEYHIVARHNPVHGVCMHRDFHGTGADHTDPGAGFPFPLVARLARRRLHRFTGRTE